MVEPHRDEDEVEREPDDPRRALVAAVPGLTDRLERGIDVLCFGCGTGERTIRLARHWPRSRFVGADHGLDEILVAGRRSRGEEVAQVRFEVRDASTLRSWSEFDLVFACSIHDEPDVDAGLRGIHRAMRFGGVLLMPAADPADAERLRRAGFTPISEIGAPNDRCHVAAK